ncbi:hypothetical protein [Arthrobacter sp. PM3]|uniref:hypothetical protein n=1 Tax=Arthrobacter sp. PM3 TaxID=2017685 RepID=UPI0021C258A7|nr:hypothetical protein [Arthrobacter sp. PM3]
MTESATLNGGPGVGSLAVGRATLADGDATLPAMSAPAMTAPGLTVPDSHAPRHCGAPMEWRAPETNVMASYSFEPAGHSAVLPALWRCRCGFQLDDVDHETTGLVAAYWQSR